MTEFLTLKVFPFTYNLPLHAVFEQHLYWQIGKLKKKSDMTKPIKCHVCHPSILIRVFPIGMEVGKALSYPLCAQ